MLLRLFGTTTSPYVRRVRIVAMELGLPIMAEAGIRQFSKARRANGCGAITSSRSAIVSPGVSAGTRASRNALPMSASPAVAHQTR